MILTYTSSRSTLAKWYWRSLRRSKRHRAFWLLWVSTAFVAGYFISSAGGASQAVAGGCAVAASLVSIGLLALYPQLRFKSQTRTLTLLRSGIDTAIASREKHYFWSEVANITADGGFVIITFRNLSAFIVPPTAFASVAEQDECVVQCVEWHRAAEFRAVS
jgi:hypothetical protein